QVKGIVYSRFGIRAGVIVLDHLSQRHAAVLRGKGNDRGGAAARGRARRGEEVVRRHDTHGGALLDMTVAIDTTWRDDATFGVDLSAAGRKFRADCRDAAG